MQNLRTPDEYEYTELFRQSYKVMDRKGYTLYILDSSGYIGGRRYPTCVAGVQMTTTPLSRAEYQPVLQLFLHAREGTLERFVAVEYSMRYSLPRRASCTLRCPQHGGVLPRFHSCWASRFVDAVHFCTWFCPPLYPSVAIVKVDQYTCTLSNSLATSCSCTLVTNSMYSRCDVHVW